MYTTVVLLFLFVGSIFATLLFFKTKKDRQMKLDSGACPSCLSKFKTFKDQTTNTMFTVDVIKSRVLKNHGCSGLVELEYTCSSCGLKEVHNSLGQGCQV
jgi:DNA-directed RNA polymerase subunit RPC12/RpoP